MKQINLLKNIMLYLLTPEDTTEPGYGCNGLQKPPLPLKNNWLGSLKTGFWMVIAIAGPLVFCTLLI